MSVKHDPRPDAAAKKQQRSQNAANPGSKERVVPSFRGPARRFWQQVREMYPDMSDSERLMQLKGQLHDPWSVAWAHYEKFQQLAYGQVSQDHYALIERLRAIHIQIKEGGVDARDVDEALDLVKSRTQVLLEEADAQ